MSPVPPIPSGSAPPCVAGLSGVRGCVVTNDSGAVLEVSGTVEEGEIVAAQAATVARELNKLGETLRVGAAQLVTIHEPSVTKIIGVQGDAIASVELEPRHNTAEVEARLRDHDWSSRFARPKMPLPPPPPEAPPPAPAGGDRATVFSGTLQLFAVPDLLEFLRASQRTGTLICRSDAGVGMVHILRGKITNARSPATGGLGQHLVRAGSISTDDLDELRAREERDPPSDGFVGRWVLERGLLDAAGLRQAVTDHVHDALLELITWTDGRFAFDSSAPADTGFPGVDVALDSQQLLLTILSAQDELERAR